MSELVRPSAFDFEPVARRYDSSRGPEPAITEALVSGLRSLHARTVVEIGAGTGNYTRELAAAGLEVVALDRSRAMARRGRENAAARWVLADALALPLRAGSLDSAVAVNVLHHLSDLPLALAELRRVVTSGIAVQAVVRENLETLWYRHYFPEIDRTLLPLHPPLGSLITSLFSAGFRRVRARPIFYSGAGDLTFEAGRTRPELLFDENFRAATSGFRRLHHRWVEAGLEALRSDLDSGRFAEIFARFELCHARYGDCMAAVASV